MNTQWTILRADERYAGAIAQFQVDMAAESEGTTLDKATVLRGVTEGLKDESKGIYLVALDSEGRAIGSLMITREWSDWNCAWYWWIQSVYVTPQNRRKGVYRSMYAKVKSMAQEADVHSLRLYVDKANLRGQSTYRTLGMAESHYLLYEEDI